MNVLQTAIDAGRQFSLEQIGIAAVGVLTVVGIVARHFRGRGAEVERASELAEAEEKGRRHGREEGEAEARWVELERSTAAIREVVDRLEGFMERLTVANETSADALLKVNAGLGQLETAAIETHKLTLALTKRRKQERRRRERRR